MEREFVKKLWGRAIKEILLERGNKNNEKINANPPLTTAHVLVLPAVTDKAACMLQYHKYLHTLRWPATIVTLLFITIMAAHVPQIKNPDDVPQIFPDDHNFALWVDSQESTVVGSLSVDTLRQSLSHQQTTSNIYTPVSPTAPTPKPAPTSAQFSCELFACRCKENDLYFPIKKIEGSNDNRPETPTDVRLEYGNGINIRIRWKLSVTSVSSQSAFFPKNYVIALGRVDPALCNQTEIALGRGVTNCEENSVLDWSGDDPSNACNEEFAESTQTSWNQNWLGDEYAEFNIVTNEAMSGNWYVAKMVAESVNGGRSEEPSELSNGIQIRSSTPDQPTNLQLVWNTSITVSWTGSVYKGANPSSLSYELKYGSSGNMVPIPNAVSGVQLPRCNQESVIVEVVAISDNTYRSEKLEKQESANLVSPTGLRITTSPNPSFTSIIVNYGASSPNCNYGTPITQRQIRIRNVNTEVQDFLNVATDSGQVTFTGLDSLTTYEFSGRRWNGKWSLDTSWGFQTTTLDGTPDVPASVQIDDIGTTSFNISWEEPTHTGEGTPRYRISWTNDGSARTPQYTSENIYLVQGLTANTNFEVWVQTESGNNVLSAESGHIMGKTKADPPPQPDFQPSRRLFRRRLLTHLPWLHDPVAGLSLYSRTLTWSIEEEEPPIISQQIRYQSLPWIPWQSPEDVVDVDISSTHTLNGLRYGLNYNVSLRTKNLDAWSVWSDEFLLLAQTARPETPGSLAATSQKMKVQLTWDHPWDNGDAIIEYRIERNQGGLQRIDILRSACSSDSCIYIDDISPSSSTWNLISGSSTTVATGTYSRTYSIEACNSRGCGTADTVTGHTDQESRYGNVTFDTSECDNFQKQSTFWMDVKNWDAKPKVLGSVTITNNGDWETDVSVHKIGDWFRPTQNIFTLAEGASDVVTFEIDFEEGKWEEWRQSHLTFTLDDEPGEIYFRIQNGANGVTRTESCNLNVVFRENRIETKPYLVSEPNFEDRFGSSPLSERDSITWTQEELKMDKIAYTTNITTKHRIFGIEIQNVGTETVDFEKVTENLASFSACASCANDFVSSSSFNSGASQNWELEVNIANREPAIHKGSISYRYSTGVDVVTYAVHTFSFGVIIQSPDIELTNHVFEYRQMWNNQKSISDNIEINNPSDVVTGEQLQITEVSSSSSWLSHDDKSSIATIAPGGKTSLSFQILNPSSVLTNFNSVEISNITLKHNVNTNYKPDQVVTVRYIRVTPTFDIAVTSSLNVVKDYVNSSSDTENVNIEVRNNAQYTEGLLSIDVSISAKGWLSPTNTGTFDIVKGLSRTISLTYEARNLVPGIYSAEINITHNDPENQPAYSNLATLTINPTAIVYPVESNQVVQFSADSESSVILKYTIRNDGLGVNLIITDIKWKSNPTPPLGTADFVLQNLPHSIAPGDQKEISISVDVSGITLPGRHQGDFYLDSISPSADEISFSYDIVAVSAELVHTCNVLYESKPDIPSCARMSPGPVPYGTIWGPKVTLMNAGSGDATISNVNLVSDENWIDLTPAIGTEVISASKEFPISFGNMINDLDGPNTYTATFSFQSTDKQNPTEITLEAEIGSTIDIPIPRLDAGQILLADYSKILSYEFRAPKSRDLQISGVSLVQIDHGWSVELVNGIVTITQGTRQNVQVRLTWESSASVGTTIDNEIRFTHDWAYDLNSVVPVIKEYTLELINPDIEITGPQSSDYLWSESPNAINIEVKNSGTADLDVRVLIQSNTAPVNVVPDTFTLTMGTKRTLAFTLQPPSASGEYVADILFIHNNPKRGNISRSISWTATTPTFTITAPLDFERQSKNIWNSTIYVNKYSFFLDVVNAGNADLEFSSCSSNSAILTMINCQNFLIGQNIGNIGQPQSRTLELEAEPEEQHIGQPQSVTISISNNAEGEAPTRILTFNFEVLQLPDVALENQGDTTRRITLNMRENGGEEIRTVTLINAITGQSTTIISEPQLITDGGDHNLVSVTGWPNQDLPAGQTHDLTMTFKPPSGMPQGYTGSFAVGLGSSGSSVKTNPIYYEVIHTEPSIEIKQYINFSVSWNNLSSWNSANPTYQFEIMNNGNTSLSVSGVTPPSNEWLNPNFYLLDSLNIPQKDSRPWDIEIMIPWLKTLSFTSIGKWEDSKTIIVASDALQKYQINNQIKINAHILIGQLSFTVNADLEYTQFDYQNKEAFSIQVQNTGSFPVTISDPPNIEFVSCTTYTGSSCQNFWWLSQNSVFPITIEPQVQISLGFTRNLTYLPVGTHVQRVNLVADTPTNNYQFDVSVTVSAKCENNCYHPNGNCPEDGPCVCQSNFTGELCQFPCPLSTDGTVCNDQGNCNVAANGNSAQCQCYDESMYGGESCQLQCNCTSKGKCVQDNDHISKCNCDPGFIGNKCELSCPDNCNENGNCTEIDSQAMCVCDNLYRGSACQIECPNVKGIACNGSASGTCDANGICTCLGSRGGNACDKKCSPIGRENCNPQHGYCNYTNEECECNVGRVGPEVGCIECNLQCGNNGSCWFNKDTVGMECVCDEGYVGDSCNHKCLDCESPAGDSICKFSNDGRAVCECEEETDASGSNFLYYGPTSKPCKYAYRVNDENLVCSGLQSAINQLGVRDSDVQLECICEEAAGGSGKKQIGKACQYECPLSKDEKYKDMACSGNGKCIAVNQSGMIAKCECDSFWEGTKCELKTDEVPPSAAISIAFVFGVKEGDTSNLNKNDLTARPEPVWDENFELSNQDTQKWMADFCDDLFAKKEIRPEHSKCMMNAFRDYILLQVNQSTSLQTICAGLNGCWPLPEDLFMPALIGWPSVGDYKFDFGIENDASRVKWMVIWGKTNIKKNQGANALFETYSYWEDWMHAQNKGKPESVSGGFQRSEVWARMVVEREFFNSITTSLSTSVLTAAISMLIFTGNFYLTGISVFLMMGTILVMIGFMAVNGMSLGAIEAISLNIIVGLSVDYSLHLGHSYQHARSQKRFYRVEIALSEIGFSLLSSACTTIGSMLILLFATIVVFVTIGTIVSVTVCVSIIFSLMGFAAILSIIGPEYQAGNVTNVVSCLRKKKNSKERGHYKGLRQRMVCTILVRLICTVIRKKENQVLLLLMLKRLR